MTIGYAELAKALEEAEKVQALEEQNEELREKLREFEEGATAYHSAVEELEGKLVDTEREADHAESERGGAIRRQEELTEAIETATSQLQDLGGVPLEGVLDAVAAIINELEAVL